MANPEIAYKELLPFYQKIKENEIIGMNRQREVIIGESLKLASYSKEDMIEFQAIKRFNIYLITTLPGRIDGFVHAANEFFFAEDIPAHALEEWDALEPEAKALKTKFINRRRTVAVEDGEESVVKTMNRISIGQGRYDTCRDFTQLNKMAKEDGEQLASINITPAEIARLDFLDTKLNSLIGDIDRKPEGLEEKKMMMFRAYTYLMQAVTPICEYGQMIFEGTDRAELYKSQSLSERGALSVAKAPVSTPTADSFGI